MQIAPRLRTDEIDLITNWKIAIGSIYCLIKVLQSLGLKFLSLLLQAREKVGRRA